MYVSRQTFMEGGDKEVQGAEKSEDRQACYRRKSETSPVSCKILDQRTSHRIQKEFQTIPKDANEDESDENKETKEETTPVKPARTAAQRGKTFGKEKTLRTTKVEEEEEVQVQTQV